MDSDPFEVDDDQFVEQCASQGVKRLSSVDEEAEMGEDVSPQQAQILTAKTPIEIRFSCEEPRKGSQATLHSPRSGALSPPGMSPRTLGGTRSAVNRLPAPQRGSSPVQNRTTLYMAGGKVIKEMQAVNAVRSLTPRARSASPGAVGQQPSLHRKVSFNKSHL